MNTLVYRAEKCFIPRPKNGGGGIDLNTSVRRDNGCFAKGSTAKLPPDLELLDKDNARETWKCINCNMLVVVSHENKRHVAFSTHRDRKCLHVDSNSRDSKKILSREYHTTLPTARIILKKHMHSEIPILKRMSDKQKRKPKVSQQMRLHIASNQDWKCAQCYKKLSSAFDVDHKIPWNQTQNSDEENLQVLCVECHRLKTSMENSKQVCVY